MARNTLAVDLYSTNKVATRKSILLVDDDPDVREYLAEMLDHYHYDVITAENGQEALAMFSTHHPELIITDILMPDIEGFELIRRIRSSDQNIPIIAISGYNIGYGKTYLSAARKLGADEILNKPFSSEELLGAIESHITQ